MALETDETLNLYQKSQKRKRKKLVKEDIPKEPVQDVYRKAGKRTVQTRHVKKIRKIKIKRKNPRDKLSTKIIPFQ